MAEIFTNLMKAVNPQIQETEQIPDIANMKKTTSRYIIVKLVQRSDKEKMLQTARENKYVPREGAQMRLTADYSLQTMEARRQWSNVFNVLRQKLLPVIRHLHKISFKHAGDFFRHTKANRFHHQDTHTAKCVKGGPLGRRICISDRKLELH